MINKKIIGQKIKTARKNRNMSQEKLAEEIGLSTNYLSKVERGLNSPSAEILLKIIEVLNLNLENFGIYQNVDTDKNKRKIIDKIMECDDKTIKNLIPVVDSVLNSFKEICK